MDEQPRKKIRRRRVRGEGSIYPYRTGREVRYRVKFPGGAGGKAGFKTHAEASAWLKAHSQNRAAPGTVGDWLTEWLALHQRDVSAATYAHDAWRVHTYLIPLLGHIRLRDLSGVAIKTMLAEMRQQRKADQPASDSERQKAGAVLRKALNFAVDHGRLTVSPMSRVRLVTPKRAEKQTLTPDELRTLVRVADVLLCGWWVRLWADAGLRPGEMLGLLWDDIDLTTGQVHVRRSLDEKTHRLKEPKTRRSRRTIDLAPSTVGSLRARSGHGVFLPDSQGGHFWLSNFSEDVLKPLGEAAGVGWISGYTFRHSMATHLLRAGRPVKEVSERLGHETPTQTLNTYAHLVPGDQKRSANVMDGLLG